MQKEQIEWYQQWSLFKDEKFDGEELFLFRDWIYPNRLEDFKDKEVLECGCGGGVHTSFIAQHAKYVIAVDLNTSDLAKERNKKFTNITFLKSDIAEMDLGYQFDIVLSIGTIHHTDNPDKTIQNLKQHLKPGGKIILWVYSKEGNFWLSNILEPIRKKFLSYLSRERILFLSKIICSLLYFPIYTIYLLPLSFYLITNILRILDGYLIVEIC